MKRNKKYVLIIIAFLIAVFWTFGSASKKVVDRVVGRINNEVILLSEFEKRSQPIMKEYERFVSVPDREARIKEVRENMLDQMIDEKLMLQKATERKIFISEAEIDQAVEEVRVRFESEIEFQNEISRQGITGSEFRKNIVDQLKVLKLVNENVRSRITPPTDEEIKKYYDENEEEMISPEQVRVRHILIKTTEEISLNEARKKINRIYKKVKDNHDKFSILAEEHSEGPSARVGGDLGYFARGNMVKEFEDVAFEMKVGDISKPVKTRFGFHIIKLVGRRASEKRTFAEVKSHLKNMLYQMRMEQEYQKFLRKLRDEAKISTSLFED